MNPAMIIILAIGAVALWFLLAEYFKDIGGDVKDTVEYAMQEMKEDEKEEDEWNEQDE